MASRLRVSRLKRVELADIGAADQRDDGFHRASANSPPFCVCTSSPEGSATGALRIAPAARAKRATEGARIAGEEMHVALQVADRDGAAGGERDRELPVRSACPASTRAAAAAVERMQRHAVIVADEPAALGPARRRQPPSRVGDLEGYVHFLARDSGAFVARSPRAAARSATRRWRCLRGCWCRRRTAGCFALACETVIGAGRPPQCRQVDPL